MRFGRKVDKPTVGDAVLTNDGEYLGAVAAVHAEHLEVEGGAVGRPVRWQVPRSAISSIDRQDTPTVSIGYEPTWAIDLGYEPAWRETEPRTIHLSVTRAEATTRAWGRGSSSRRGVPPQPYTSAST